MHDINMEAENLCAIKYLNLNLSNTRKNLKNNFFPDHHNELTRKTVSGLIY